MKTGNRKLIVFFFGILTVLTIIMTALIKNVNFTGDNITNLCWIILFFAITFTGGNAAEWFSKAKVGKIE